MDIESMLRDHYGPRFEKRRKLTTVSPTRMLKCPRGAVLEMFGYREPVDTRSQILNLDYGSWRHDELQGVLIKRGVLERNPHPLPGRSPAEFQLVKKDPPIMGFCDGFIKDENRIIEIKTTSKPLGTIDHPLSDHVSQAQIYMHLSGTEGAIILYESKDFKDDPWKLFEIEYDEVEADLMMDRARAIITAVKHKFLPARARNCYCRNPACWSKKVQREEGLKG